MNIFGRQISNDALKAQTGSLAQVASIRQLRLDDGPQKGDRLIQIQNAAGLMVELLPDRCLDIGQVYLRGVPFAWIGPWGLSSSGPGINMDNALGGLMATCGFDHIRQPITHEGLAYPLHGSMPLKACDSLLVHSTPSADGDFIVESKTQACAPNGAQYILSRRITIPFAQNEICLEDTIATTPANPIFALYHINLGFPLIAADTQVTVDDTAITDRLAPTPQIQISQAPQQHYTIGINSGEESNRMALDILCDGSQLPWLQTYRRAEAGMNLFCVEPVTHDRKPRAELLKDAAMPTPSQHFAIKFSFQVGV